MGDTKVFGIGFQRTGTGSLNEALNLLGIKSKHNAQELFDNHDHAVLRRFDGFSDNPIPLIYQHLDRALPGSKFVFTHRDVDSWLGSVEWLFTEGRVQYGWDQKPVVDRIHEALYGTTQFDASVFRERFLCHRQEVDEYFADRPGDLLIIDLRDEEPWPPLCDFLGLEIPALPFPHGHRREDTSSAPWPRLLQRLRRWRGA